MKLFSKRFNFFSILILVLLITPFLVFGIGSPSLGYRIYKNNLNSLEPVFWNTTNSTSYIATTSIGACVTNSSSNDYFVPTKTVNEWNSFVNSTISNTSLGLNVVGCCGDKNCNTSTESPSNCLIDCSDPTLCANHTYFPNKTTCLNGGCIWNSYAGGAGCSYRQCEYVLTSTECANEGCYWNSYSGTCSSDYCYKYNDEVTNYKYGASSVCSYNECFIGATSGGANSLSVCSDTNCHNISGSISACNAASCHYIRGGCKFIEDCTLYGTNSSNKADCLADGCTWSDYNTPSGYGCLNP